ncbi:MAG: protein NO VEIN domain-containing protein [Phycisphaerae bacterium]
MPAWSNISKEDVVKALSELSAGHHSKFAASRDYDVVWRGRRFAPKAVVGLAYEIATGTALAPQDFSGGEHTGQANRVLEILGFSVVPKNWSKEENAETAAAYFDMFRRNLRAESFVKADVHRVLQEKLLARTEAAIKQKFENISSYLASLGFTPMTGYSPNRSNRQEDLERAVDRYLATHPEIVLDLRKDAAIPQKRQYWALLVDPNIYDMISTLRDLPESTWTFTRGKPHAGDGVIFWKAKGGESHRGIIGLGEIIAEPVSQPEPVHLRKYWIEGDPNVYEPRAWIRHLHAPGLPYWLENDPTGLLASLPVAKAAGGSIFYLDEDQWNSVLRLIHAETTSGGNLSKESEEDSAPIVDGQGYGLTQPERRAVELHAMKMASSFFESRGYRVQDVHVGNCYDLMCTAERGDFFRVEVKGTTTSGESVILTANEVKLATADPAHSVLFLVYDIELVECSDGPIARGGQQVIIREWKPRAECLTPLTYKYRLQTNLGSEWIENPRGPN